MEHELAIPDKFGQGGSVGPKNCCTSAVEASDWKMKTQGPTTVQKWFKIGSKSFQNGGEAVVGGPRSSRFVLGSKNGAPSSKPYPPAAKTYG